MKSIAFPAISTGAFGYPSKDAAKAAIDETRKFLEKPANVGKLQRVVFCNFEPKDVSAYEALIP
jgi:O-acetyl-ADP-ribose deacetylase (regulator of RNase III)